MRIGRFVWNSAERTGPESRVRGLGAKVLDLRRAASKKTNVKRSAVIDGQR